MSQRTINPNLPRWVFFDGKCGLCRGAADLLHRLGPHAPMRFIDINDPQQMRNWPQISPEKARSEVHTIDANGRMDVGFEGVVVALAQVSRLGRGLLPLLLSRPVRRIGSSVYHWVSKHRYQLSGESIHEAPA